MWKVHLTVSIKAGMKSREKVLQTHTAQEPVVSNGKEIKKRRNNYI